MLLVFVQAGGCREHILIPQKGDRPLQGVLQISAHCDILDFAGSPMPATQAKVITDNPPLLTI